MTVTETEPTTKLRIFSGIQPTGQPHIGNYSGGFRQYKATQDSGGDAFFCIVDLHAITVPHDPSELKDGLLPESCRRARRGGLAAVGRD